MPAIRLLDRYIFKELVIPMFAGTALIVVMFQANFYMGLAKELQLSNVPLSAVMQVIFYHTPFFINMTLPIGMALATSLTISRLARESEITAMRAAGVPVLRVIVPLAIFGLLVSAFHFFDVEKLMPPAEKRANDMQAKVAGLGYTPTFIANKPITLGKFSATLGKVSRQEGSMDMDVQSVLLIERPDVDTTNITTAESATYRGGIWTFHHGYFYEIHKGDLLVARPEKDFTINEPVMVDAMFGPPAPEQMSILELRQGIQNATSTGSDSRRFQIALYDKFFVPLSCFVFSFVSPMLAMRFARSSAFAGVLLSFVVALAYYNVYIVCTQILNKIDSIPAFAISAFPDALFLAVGLWAVRQLE